MKIVDWLLFAFVIGGLASVFFVVYSDVKKEEISQKRGVKI